MSDYLLKKISKIDPKYKMQYVVDPSNHSMKWDDLLATNPDYELNVDEQGKPIVYSTTYSKSDTKDYRPKELLPETGIKIRFVTPPAMSEVPNFNAFKRSVNQNGIAEEVKYGNNGIGDQYQELAKEAQTGNALDNILFTAATLGAGAGGKYVFDLGKSILNSEGRMISPEMMTFIKGTTAKDVLGQVDIGLLAYILAKDEMEHKYTNRDKERELGRMLEHPFLPKPIFNFNIKPNRFHFP